MRRKIITTEYIQGNSDHFLHHFPLFNRFPAVYPHISFQFLPQDFCCDFYVQMLFVFAFFLKLDTFFRIAFHSVSFSTVVKKVKFSFQPILLCAKRMQCYFELLLQTILITKLHFNMLLPLIISFIEHFHTNKQNDVNIKNEYKE